MEKLSNLSENCFPDNLDPNLIPDVVLQVGTERLHAHRAILACQSKFLKQMFLAPEHTSDKIVIFLPDFIVPDVRKLLDFLYGKLSVSESSRDLIDSLFLGQDNKFDSLNSQLEKNTLFDGNAYNGMEQTDIETTEVLIDNNNYCRRVYDGSENVFCGLCNLGFTSEAMLTSHFKQHPVCNLCNIQFVREIDLLQHVSTHPQCGVCGEQLLDQLQLEIHEKSHSNLNDPFGIPCNISIDLGNIELVNDPLIEGKRCSQLFQEVNPDLYIDNVECANSTSQDKSLNYLESVQFVNNEAVQFINLCNFCNKDFESQEELLHHTALEHRDYVDAVDPDHHQSPVNEEIIQTTFQYMCSICHIPFEKIVSLTKHVISNHNVQQLESGKLFNCKFCPNASFLMIKDLITHSNYYHSDEEDKSVSCPECPNKKFKSLKMLKSHLNVHVTQKPFQCAICFKVFSWENGLRQHNLRCDCGRSRDRSMKSSEQSAMTRKYVTKKKKAVATSVIMKNLTFTNPNVSNDSTSTSKRRFTCQACGLVVKTREMIRDHVQNCKQVLLKDAESQGSKEQEAGVVEDEEDGMTPRENEEIVNVDDYDYDGEDLDMVSHMESFKDFLNYRVRNNNDTPYPRVYKKTKKVKPRIYECTECFKKFRTSYHLKEHHFTHTGEYPLKCSDCGRGFMRKRQLLDHICNLSLKKDIVTSDKSQEEEETFLDEFKRSIEQEAEEERRSFSRRVTFDCSLCGLGYESLARLDAHMEIHGAGQDTPITRQGSEKTRSGRVIKPKRFFEDLNPETRTRRRRKTGPADGRETPVEGDRRDKCVLLSTQCSYCELDLETHVELFRHVLGHLDPDIVKTFPVYEDGDTGWCPNCCEPVTLNFAEEHMMEKHSDMIIYRPEPPGPPGDRDNDVTGPDQQRSVIKIPRKVDQVLREVGEDKFSSKVDENC